MLGWNLVNGAVKFLKHTVVYSFEMTSTGRDGEKITKEKIGERHFDSIEEKNNFVGSLTDKNIAYTVTDYDEPSEDLLQAALGKKFNTTAEAREFIEAAEGGIIPKSADERINDLELLVLQLGGII